MSVKISALDAVATLATDDVVPVVDVSTGTTVKATVAQIASLATGGAGAYVDATTGTVVDYATTDVAANEYTGVYFTDGATVSGLAGGRSGRRIILHNATILTEDLSSFDYNRIAETPSGNIPTPDHGGIELQYVGEEGDPASRWYMVTGDISSLPSPTAPLDVLISDDGLTWTTRRLTDDDIGDPFTVDMAYAGSTTVQVGASVATPAFTATYPGGAADTVVLTDNAGSSPKDVTSTPTSFSSDGTFTRTTNNQSYTFTTTADKGAVQDTDTITITWSPRVYYGAETPAAYTEAFIEALATSALASSRARSFTVNAGATEKIYYAFPTSYGTPTFTVGGFEGGFDLVGSAVSVTNSDGVTQNYDIWGSTNVNLGSTTVVVT